MNEQTKQLLQKITIEKMTKEWVKKLLHEINTKKMINGRARRKAFTRNKHWKKDECTRRETTAKNMH